MRNGHVLLAVPMHAGWKSILGVVLEVLNQVRLRVKEGRSSFWYDCWLASGPLSQFFVSILNPLSQIKDVWLDDAWDRDVLIELVGGF